MSGIIGDEMPEENPTSIGADPHDSAVICTAAIEILGYIGESALKAVPVLIDCLSKPEFHCCD
jgi:hypothetical protein